MQKGFTVIELMVTVAVAAVLMAIAVPSFRHLTESHRLDTSINELVDALHLARMEAVKGNTHAQFCGQGNNGNDTLGKACQGSPGAVYLLQHDKALKVGGGLNIGQGSLHIKTLVPVVFNGQGIGRSLDGRDVVAVLCSDAINSNNMRQIHLLTGFVINTDKVDGACP